jgi:hypothetical protein
MVVYSGINERLREVLVPPKLPIHSAPQRKGRQRFCQSANVLGIGNRLGRWIQGIKLGEQYVLFPSFGNLFLLML